MICEKCKLDINNTPKGEEYIIKFCKYCNPMDIKEYIDAKILRQKPPAYKAKYVIVVCEPIGSQTRLPCDDIQINEGTLLIFVDAKMSAAFKVWDSFYLEEFSCD